MIQVIADSTCDMPDEWKKTNGLISLPLSVTINNQNFKDGIEISVEQIYAEMRKGILPKTAQIPYDTMKDAFENCCKQGMEVLFISFSGEMSGGYNLAHIVIEDLKETYPTVRLEAVDSRGGSFATGLIVLQALKMAQNGRSMDEILKEIAFQINHVEHVFSVADLNWMVKGGRISKPIGTIGSVLDIRPWLDVEDGKMIVKGMVRGEKKALARVAEEVVKRAAHFPDQLIAITHADDIEAATKIQDKIKAALPDCQTVICQIGGVLGVHIGIGGVGVFFFNEKSPNYCI